MNVKEKYKGLSKNDLINIIEATTELYEQAMNIPKPKTPPSDQTCSNCGKSCFATSSTNANTQNYIVSSCCKARVIFREEKGNDMNEWKDLEISNIPSDFFVNDRYLVKIDLSIDANDTVWSEEFESLKTSLDIVLALRLGISSYRYKLKPLDSIRITKEQWKQICSNCLTSHEEQKNMTWDNRKVEIID